MRTALAIATLLCCSAPSARADDANSGSGSAHPPTILTVPQTPNEPPPMPKLLLLVVGERAKLDARNGSQLVCDDASIAHAEAEEDALFLVADHAGTTLCAARFAGTAQGLYTVRVSGPRK